MSVLPWILTALMPASTVDEVTLRHDVHVGEVRHFDVTSETTMTVAANRGPTVSSETDLRVRCRVEVLANDDDAFTVAVRWTEIEGFVELPMLGRVPFDSTLEDEPAPAEDGVVGALRSPWLALAGTEFEACLSHTGEVLALPRIGAYLSAARERVAQGPNAGMVRALLEEEAVRTQLGLLFPVYPPQPIAIGDEWSSRIEDQIGNAQPVEMVSENDHRIVAAGDREVSLRGLSRAVQFDAPDATTGARHQAYVIDTADGSPRTAVVTAECSRSRRTLLGGSTRSSIDVEATLTRVD